MNIQKVSVHQNQKSNQIQKQNNSQPAFGAKKIPLKIASPKVKKNKENDWNQVMENIEKAHKRWVKKGRPIIGGYYSDSEPV